MGRPKAIHVLGLMASVTELNPFCQYQNNYNYYLLMDSYYIKVSNMNQLQ